ncbi:MAG: hypothetical protein ABJA37_13720 [Ferruginibacter sp.]
MYTAEEHKIIATLKGHGIQITQNRIFIFRLLCEHKNALSITYINKYFTGNIDRISLYRTLKIFEKKRLLVKVPNPASEATYLFKGNESILVSKQNKKAAYFICTACKSITLLNESIFDKFRLPVNLSVTQCHIIIEGVCNICGK